MKTNLIAISGKINSGKDTFTEIFQSIAFCKSTLLWENRKFGYKVKAFASMLTGIPAEDFEKREIKAMNLPDRWNLKHSDLKQFKKKKGEVFMTGRDLLIRIGDGLRREVHPDVWINALFSERENIKEIKDNSIKDNSIINISLITPQKLSNWIISDLRYINEAEKIKEEGGKLIRIFSNREEKINHISETSLDNYQNFDYIVDNSGTIEELRNSVYNLGSDLGVW